MRREAVERFCEAALRTRKPWGEPAARHLRAATVVLEAAAVAQGELRWILSRGEHELSPEEQVVFREYDLCHVGFHLAALAVEGCLRVLGSRRNRPRSPSGSADRPGILLRHNLPVLAHRAGLELTREERGLLTDLSQIIDRHGRDSVPPAGQRVRAFYKGEGAYTADLPWPEALERLVERLSSELGARV